MPNNHEAKQWSFEDFKYFMDNRNVKSKAEFTHELNRSKGAIYAMEIIARLYAKNPDNKNVSKNMRKHFERYYHGNGQALASQEVFAVQTNVTALGKAETKIAELDQILNVLRDKITEVIAVAVQDKLEQERKATVNELKDLRQFKDSVRKDSLFVQLTKKLNNIV
jgi:hypothetical protein